ncbi:hypothetical protein [Dysgonomonas reticulitermitis]
MSDYKCEICGKQKAENFRFEYGIITSYQRTQTGTTTKGVFNDPYNVYQTQTTYKIFGENTVHLCLNCINERVRVYKTINYIPIGIGLLLFLLFGGLSFKEIMQGREEAISVLFGILIFTIPAYFITRYCLIRHYSKRLNINRKEIKEAIKLGLEFLNKRWRDKAETVCYYQYQKIKPLENIFKESGQLKVQGKDQELIVIPASAYDDTKDPDFIKIFRI